MGIDVTTLALSKAYTNSVALGQGAVQGQPGANGRTPEISSDGTHIRWRYVGDTAWINLVPLADLMGKDGIDGTNGIDGINGLDGVDGETPQFRMNGNTLQYRFPTVTPNVWTDLFTFSGGGEGGGGYSPPPGGIPRQDLSQDVRTSLGRADSALQSFTETDPVYMAARPTIVFNNQNNVITGNVSINGDLRTNNALIATEDFVNLALETVPSGGLSVPVVLPLESSLPAISTRAVGDYFFLQNMDVTAPERTGKAWVNYVTPSNPASGLAYYKVVDQFLSPDTVTIILSPTGQLKVSTAWLNSQLDTVIQYVDNIIGNVAGSILAISGGA